jgi:nucleoside-diphosphate-sugar epimerase
MKYRVIKTALVTGGAGFFGTILIRALLARGIPVISIDVVESELNHPLLRKVKADITDLAELTLALSGADFSHVFHCAALLAHGALTEDSIFRVNVDGTRNVVRLASNRQARGFVFLSTNCLWARPFGRPVMEEDLPEPIEAYGKSKALAEQLIQQELTATPYVIIRCPTIVDQGRLGLLAILFEFIAESRNIWMVGKGENRYQFVYAPDLVAACLEAAVAERRLVLNIGSDDVPTMAETFEHLIASAGSASRLIRLPKSPAIAAMKLAHALRISPLGPYQYRMIAESFVFDTSRIKGELHWRPTLGNKEMLAEAFAYYQTNRDEIESRKDVSAHRAVSPMGIIRLIKYLS